MTDSLLPADDGAHEAENDPALLQNLYFSYTLSATAQGSETDTLMINNFLTTLADVAIAVASRNLREKQEGEG